jgi:trehalose synthase
VFENALRMHLNHDLVMVDDPQPLPLIRHFRKKAPWLGRCHGDLSNPNQELRSYLAGFIVHAKSAAKSIDRRQRRECRGDR